MLGLDKKQADDDTLPVFVHVVQSNDAFAVAKKLWDENVRLLHINQSTGKEFLRFTYARPACNVWLQRDQGREDMFELLLLWKDGQRTTEVYMLAPQASQHTSGDVERLNAVLNAMLTTPSIVPAR
jgi:hypothetical protein